MLCTQLLQLFPILHPGINLPSFQIIPIAFVLIGFAFESNEEISPMKIMELRQSNQEFQTIHYEKKEPQHLGLLPGMNAFMKEGFLKPVLRHIRMNEHKWPYTQSRILDG